MKITEEGRELGLRHHYFRNWIEKKREKKKKKKKKLRSTHGGQGLKEFVSYYCVVGLNSRSCSGSTLLSIICCCVTCRVFFEFWWCNYLRSITNEMFFFLFFFFGDRSGWWWRKSDINDNVGFQSRAGWCGRPAWWKRPPRLPSPSTSSGRPE